MLHTCGELLLPCWSLFPGLLIPPHLFVPRCFHSNWNDDFQVSRVLSTKAKNSVSQSATAPSEANLEWRGEVSSHVLSAVSPASFSGVWGSFGVHAEHQVLPSTFEQRHVSAQLLSRVRLRMGGFYSLWLWTAKGLAIWSPSQSSSFAEEEFEAQMKPFAYYSSILNVPKISLEYLHILVSPSISNSTWFTMVMFWSYKTICSWGI